MAGELLGVARIGMGWWSDVLADAIQRSGKLKIVACFTCSEGKRLAFAAKYGCRPAISYEVILADTEVEAIINTTPNDAHLQPPPAAGLPTASRGRQAGHNRCSVVKSGIEPYCARAAGLETKTCPIAS